MSEAYISEIRIFSFPFAPKGWALCNGQLMSIAQNQALFSLLGTTYGGDGIQTFALPNLKERVPLSFGGGLTLGEGGGAPTVTLINTQLPAHTHIVLAANGGDSNASVDPANMFPAGGSTAKVYSTSEPGTIMLAGGAIAADGASQAHTNTQPSLVLNYCIATVGIFPSRN